ncbi:MAG: asparagine synthase (glutamine-hydrolyzing) [Desulfobacter sp.]|nr:MAG: asparagine synthase (glutamine-hydrolyzing) [Desulfobacter sp.]
MCGIAGIVRFGQREVPGEIDRMVSALSHRGPDASDVWRKGPVALGHARLSIIDIMGGGQPMVNNDGTLCISYNGEIFNFLDLRRELAAEGVQFYTTSDTEVLLAAYQRWGRDCVNRLNGMFAFCIADYQRQELFLARDHAGIKPLYYRREKDFFAFASELEALKMPEAPLPQGRLQSIDYFLRYQYIPAPDTIYRNVYKLQPAHSMCVSFDGTLNAPRRYWRIRFSESKMRRDEILEGLEKIAGNAVRRAMVSDVPVGLFCSGGMDSSLVAHYASRHAKGTLKAFSIGFDESRFSELPQAKKLADNYGFEFCHEVLGDSALDVLPELILQYGEPFGDSSAVPTFYLSRLARSQVKTVLSGDGGDEIFGGYDRFFEWVNRGWWPRQPRHQFRLDARAGRFKTVKAILDALGVGPEAWSYYIYLTQYHQRARLWRPEFKGLIDTPSALFLDTWHHARRYRGMAYAQCMDFETYLPGAVLNKVDIASMCHGLEVRPPLLDRELVEFASRLPMDLKYSGGGYGKIAVQKILENRAPDQCIKRPKMGFGIPRQKWMLPGTRGGEMVNDYLRGQSSPLNEWFSPSHIRWHIDMHSADQDNSHHLWLLLVLALWADCNKGIGFS